MPVFFAIVAIIIAALVSGGLGRDAEVKLSIYQAEQQSQLDTEQRAILASIEGVNNPHASQFVADWRAAYPAASAEGLQELRIIEAKVKADPASAQQFTLKAKQQKADQLNAAISVPFGGEFKAKPGI